MNRVSKKVLFFFYNYGFWLLFFILGKIIFFLYNSHKGGDVDFSSFVLALAYGLKLDTSMTAYLSFIPALVLFITAFFRTKIDYLVIKYYTLLCLILCSSITIIDLKLYSYWGMKLDQEPLKYFDNPSLMFASIAWVDIFILLCFTIIYIVVFFYSYKKLVAPLLLPQANSNYIIAGFYLFIASTLFIPARGGIDFKPKIRLGIPISAGTVYFHDHIFVNHVALNPQWYFLQSIMVNKDDDDSRYRYFENGKETLIYNTEIKESGETRTFLVNQKRPNVVLLILESFTVNLMETFDGNKGVTPNLDQYAKEGILFDRFYASGTNSDKGMAAIFSGFPSMPDRSILKNTSKMLRLPHLMGEFNSLGYHPYYYYGGDINFVNFKMYFKNGGAEKIIHRDHFPFSDRQSKWGVPDHIMLNKMARDINDLPSPFFCSAFTLSSHHPFDVPMKTVIEGEDDDHRFLNAAYYTDKSVGEFIENAKKQDWWDNTLIIITADHSTDYTRPGPRYEPNKFHIPMIWMGGALAVTDTTIHQVFGQYDIPKTLLAQLGHQTENFLFSNNIFSDDYKGNTFYSLRDGFGFLTDTTTSFYGLDSEKYYIKTDTTRKDILEGKAFMQVLAKYFKDI